MSSAIPAALSTKSSGSSKSAASSSQLSPAYAQVGPAFTGDGAGQRRSGGPGSCGSGPGTRAPAAAAARNNQTAKSKHKQSKRFRLADDDALAESEAMQSTSSRRGQTSITHLMNFSLPPRPQDQHEHRFDNGRSQRRNPTWGLGSGYHAADKSRYVHANYRFIVDPRGDYKPQSMDADIHLDWNTVLQILVSTQSQTASCPICLGLPVAPRMAKCGHIFCLPCLIRYMHSEDGAKALPEKRARWKKCPICWDAIYVSETRPVRWYTGQEEEPPREGHDVVLRLVKRLAGSTLAMPRESTDALAKREDVPWYFAAEVMDYARVMKGSEDYMTAQLESDISAVRTMEQEDEVMFGEDTEWTGKALKTLYEAKEKVKGVGNSPAMPNKPEEPKPRRPPIDFIERDDVPDMYGIQQAARSGKSIPTNQHHHQEGTATAEAAGSLAFAGAQSADNVLSTRMADFRAQLHADRQPESYLFYQALLHYYLSPLDIRILREAFGSYESFPSSILTRVERVSTGHIVDDELRKRVRYLAHLPHGCEVGFLECDWTDTVPPSILDRFKADIERRRKRNSEKKAREEKERVRAEKAEDREYAAARRRRPSNPTTDRFSQADFQPLVTADATDSAASLDGGTTSSSPPWSTHHTNSSAYASLASPGTSPSASRTVWGTAAVATSTTPELGAVLRDDWHVDDGWLQDWERDLLGEDDALVARVQAATLAEGPAAPSCESSSAASAAASAAPGVATIAAGAGAVAGKGKKKGKKITLMSTTARRGA